MSWDETHNNRGILKYTHDKVLYKDRSFNNAQNIHPHSENRILKKNKSKLIGGLVIVKCLQVDINLREKQFYFFNKQKKLF